ncbi:MAG: T9SS type A sorting domain-containing protein, partial [Bacteroidota bacterium]
SGHITAMDLIELRKVILFINEQFTNNTSWRFVDANYAFVNPMNPWATTFPEAVTINGLSDGEIADFIGIKVGDVNNSAIANQLQTGETRNADQALELAVDEQTLSAGSTYRVDFKARDFKAIQGYQFTMTIDANAELVDVHTGTLPGLAMEHFNVRRMGQGILTTSWNTWDQTTLEDEAIVFSVELKAKADVQLSEILSINSNLTQAEAYSASGERMDIGLVFGQANGTTKAPFALYQNQPNPFKSETLISFNLPEASKATLTIYDLSGRVVRQVTGEYSKGYQQVSIEAAELNGVGMYYYRLETDKHSAVRKMIVH